MQDRPQQTPQKRLDKILEGAFADPPTPLKDIPKRDGESRTAKSTSKRPKKSRTNIKSRVST